MYTECNRCNAVFLISDEQLKAAAGKVRCGQCQHIFVAREVMVSGDPRMAGQTVSPSEQNADPELISISRMFEAPDLDMEERKPVESQPPQFKVRGLEDNESGQEEERGGGWLKWFSSKERAEERETAAIHKETQSFYAQGVGDEPPIPVGKYTSSKGQHRGSKGTEVNSRLFRHDSELDRDLERFDSADEMTFEGPAYFEQTGRRGNWIRSLARSLLVLTGIMLLAAVFFVQWLFADTQRFVEFPRLQMYAVEFCQNVGCEPPYSRQSDQIEITQRSIVSHPEMEKALLVTANLVNRAALPQPLPIMELKLNGLQGQIVALRRFEPKEYLSKKESSGLMQPNQPVSIRLEILDPGDDAVAFQFAFY